MPDEDDSDEDYEEEPQREMNFIDIANRPSVLHTQVPPHHMLENFRFSWPSKDGQTLEAGTLLQRAIVEDDFEAFVKISDLYKTLPEIPSIHQDNVLSWVLQNDRPEMLDELIRRAGAGIIVPQPAEDAKENNEGQPDASTSVRRLYLGLTVNGKKRKDLAIKNDPNAVPSQGEEKPLVLRAAMLGAHEVLKYLHGSRPLSAYRYFTSTNSKDPRAKYLRDTPNLPVVLPSLLGWEFTVLNESPLTAAIASNRFETVQMLYELSPNTMEPALHTK